MYLNIVLFVYIILFPYRLFYSIYVIQILCNRYTTSNGFIVLNIQVLPEMGFLSPDIHKSCCILKKKVPARIPVLFQDKPFVLSKFNGFFRYCCFSVCGSFPSIGCTNRNQIFISLRSVTGSGQDRSVASADATTGNTAYLVCQRLSAIKPGGEPWLFHHHSNGHFPKLSVIILGSGIQPCFYLLEYPMIMMIMKPSPVLNYGGW